MQYFFHVPEDLDDLLGASECDLANDEEGLESSRLAVLDAMLAQGSGSSFRFFTRFCGTWKR